MTLLLFLLCLSLAGLFLWAGRNVIRHFWAARFQVSPDSPGLPDYWDARLVGGAGIMLALAAFLGFVLIQEFRAPAQLAEYIAVYPHLSSASWVPPVSEELYWIFESPDDLDSIATFYEEVAKNSGWEMTRSGNTGALFLQLKKSDVIITLMASRRGTRSNLAYQVTRLSRDSGRD